MTKTFKELKQEWQEVIYGIDHEDGSSTPPSRERMLEVLTRCISYTNTQALADMLDDYYFQEQHENELRFLLTGEGPVPVIPED